MEYGLVLGGGGTMGSYEIGVWKALRELDVYISAVAGTSIGAINGAIIAQNDLEWAIEFWSNLKIEDVLLMDKNVLEKFNAELLKFDFLTLLTSFGKLISDGGLDISPLKENIKKYISEDRVRKSPIKLGLVTVSLTDRKPLELMIDQIPVGKLHDFLLASAALPAFKKHEIDGSVFIDGAFYDNLPENLLISNGYKNLITVTLPSLGINTKPKKKDLNIIALEPSDQLGAVLDFTPNLMKQNIQLGYLDTLKKVNQLCGIHYFIDFDKEDASFNKFTKKLGNPLKSEIKIQLPFLLSIDSITSKADILQAIHKLITYTKYKDSSNLPLSLLEITGISLNIERLRVYKPRELIHEILFTLNNLLKENMEFMENSNTIMDMLKSRNEQSVAPHSNLKFLAYYLFITNVHTKSIKSMAKLINRFSPEIALSIITLLYLTEK